MNGAQVVADGDVLSIGSGGSAYLPLSMANPRGQLHLVVDVEGVQGAGCTASLAVSPSSGAQTTVTRPLASGGTSVLSFASAPPPSRVAARGAREPTPGRSRPVRRLERPHGRHPGARRRGMGVAWTARPRGDRGGEPPLAGFGGGPPPATLPPAADGRVLRAPGGISGLLSDQAEVAEGFLHLWQATGERRWRDAALRAVLWARDHLAAEGGGLGLLRHAHRPMMANAAMADACWRLGVLTADRGWLDVARSAADTALAEGEGFGILAANAAAVRERIDGPAVVVKTWRADALRDAFLAEGDTRACWPSRSTPRRQSAWACRRGTRCPAPRRPARARAPTAPRCDGAWRSSWADPPHDEAVGPRRATDAPAPGAGGPRPFSPRCPLRAAGKHEILLHV